MGRPRSNYACPKCGKQGYKEKNPTKTGKYWRVVHYDYSTKTRHRHYLGNKMDLVKGVSEISRESTKEEYPKPGIITENITELIRREFRRMAKDGVFSGDSEITTEGTVIPVKYKFFPNKEPKLVLTIDKDRDKRHTNDSVSDIEQLKQI